MDLRRLTAAAFGHFSIDVLNSSIAMILTHLSGNFQLSVSQIGFGAMVYTVFAAMTQPFFGALADRWRGRWLAGFGVLWTAIFFALGPFMPNYPAFLICLTIGAWGSGALHAAGMVNANAAGGSRPALATSIFFVAGQIGLSIGPLAAGYYLQHGGLTGMIWSAVGMLPAVALMLLWLRKPLALEATPVDQASAKAQHSMRRGATAVILIAFVLFIALRSTTTQTLSTLLPKYYDNQGIPTTVYGVMLSVFSFSGAMGTFIGGWLGDRYNRRVILFSATLLSVPACFALLSASGWLFYLLAIFSGLLLNIPHSILIVMSQQLIPQRKGLMGGLTLGFMFAAGAIGVWIAGWFADSNGLPVTLAAVTFLPLGAACCALLLPPTRRAVTVPTTLPATANAGD